MGFWHQGEDKYSHRNVITHPRRNLNGVLAKPVLKLP